MLTYIRKVVVFVILCGLCSACLNLETICADSIELPVSVNFRQKIRIRRLAQPDSIVFRDTFLFIKQIRITDLSDKILYNFTPSPSTPEDSLNTFNFPYNPLKDSVHYSISYRRGNPLQEDILAFRYNRLIELSSPECGIRTNYSNLQILEHSFDSLVLKTNPQGNVSLDIYYFAQ
ncbi:MAG: hypothetical protein OHK0045_10260 [Raineya sp.]